MNDLHLRKVGLVNDKIRLMGLKSQIGQLVGSRVALPVRVGVACLDRVISSRSMSFNPLKGVSTLQMSSDVQPKVGVRGWEWRVYL